jgi:molecular chaperone GrpE
VKGNNHRHGEGHKVPINESRMMEEEGMEQPKGETSAESETRALAEGLEKAAAELAEYKDKYLRLLADTENFKKRMNRELAEREKYHNEGIIKELLPVMDNLDRAIAHAGENAGGPEGIVEGVRMVKKQLMDAFTKFGVTEVVSVGLPFDPARQQAIMQVETDKYEPGTVVEEFQKGYFLNDRILRPAMVTVAKPPAGPPEASEEQ